MKPFPGLLISFEGIDGSGKSLLVHNVAAALERAQLPLVVTKEPGGTWLGAHLRSILQQRTDPLNSVSEFLLFAADRAQHFDHIIIPALKSGKIVVSDRMADSSLAYQGYGRGIDKEMITSVNRWAMQGIKPDLTVYLHLEHAQARARIAARQEKLTAFEQEPASFWKSIIAGFETMFANRTDVLRLDALQEPQQLCTATVNRIIALMKERART